MIEPPASVRPQFVAAGWHPGRRVEVSPAVPSDHPAAVVLAAFGGLTVSPDRDSGEECGPTELEFCELDVDRSGWSQRLGVELVGIADLQWGHGELFLANDGRCFGRSRMHPAFFLVGESFAAAVEAVLLGRRSRPLLRPDQTSVTLYGIRYTADSPEVYRY